MEIAWKISENKHLPQTGPDLRASSLATATSNNDHLISEGITSPPVSSFSSLLLALINKPEHSKKRRDLVWSGACSKHRVMGSQTP